MNGRAVRTMTPRARKVAALRLRGLKVTELVNVLASLDVAVSEAMQDAAAFQAKRILIYAEIKRRGSKLGPDPRVGRQTGRPGPNIERQDVADAMKVADGSMTQAAGILGISKRWLRNRLKAFGLRRVVSRES